MLDSPSLVNSELLVPFGVSSIPVDIKCLVIEIGNVRRGRGEGYYDVSLVSVLVLFSLLLYHQNITF